VRLGHLVEHLVHGDADEIREMQVDDRLSARARRGGRLKAAAPPMAARTPAPTSAVSEIGVSSTRSGNSSFMPANWPKMPPCLAMSSP